MSATVAAPWEAYAQATRVDHFADWCAQHCVQSVDRFAGQPLELEDFQHDMMGEALAELAEDEAYWQTVGLVIPKKNGKTSLLAAYGLYHLLEDEGAPEILLAAASDKQAGRLFRAATAFARADPWLHGQLVIREHEGEIARDDGFATLYRVSGDSGTLSGYNPSLVIADELADWRTPRRRRAWSMLATGGMVRRQVHVFAISTAGEPQERVDGILGQLIDRNEADGDLERVHRALTISRNHQARTLVYNYDANTSEVDDLDALEAANPASWITRERLAELAANPSLTPGRFLQLHGCVWTASEGGYLDLEVWRELGRDDRLRAGEEVLLGFRGGDTCALVACRRADGMLHTLGVWDDHPVSEAIDDTLAWATDTYQVGAVFSSHTPEWKSMVDAWRQDLGKRRVTDVDIARPSPRTTQITERFKADTVAGRVRHDGSRRLAAHVVAARIARARSQPYLVPDARNGTPIAAAQAAMLAWEARALGVWHDTAKTPGRAIFT